RDNVARAPDAGGIARRTDQDEVVVHYGEPLYPEALGQELLLSRLGGHEDDICVPPPVSIEALAGALRPSVHGDPGVCLEDRQQITEQSRILGGRCRCNHDGLFLFGRDAAKSGRRCNEDSQYETTALHRSFLLSWSDQRHSVSKQPKLANMNSW